MFETKLNYNIIGLTNELKSIYIFNSFCRYQRPILVVTSTTFEANNFYQSLNNYDSNTLFFPMDDFLTSEAIAISPEFKTTRLETLNQLNQNKNHIVVTSLMGYLRYLPSKKEYLDQQIILEIGKTYNSEELFKKLIDIGYERETIVNKTGEVAKRGYVIDIFLIQEENPVRIEFWGDTIESIKYFDVNSQRTIKELKDLKITPNQEIANNHQSILNYLENPIVVFIDYNNLLNNYELLLEEIENYNQSKQIEKKYMFNLDEILYNDAIYFSSFDNQVIKIKDKIKYESKEIDYFPTSKENINHVLKSYKNRTVIIALENRKKANEVIDNLDNKDLIITDENHLFEDKYNIIYKKISEGFEIDKCVVITEKELFNSKNSNSYKTSFRIGTKIKDLSKLEIGDYIVHSMYGIGKYLGIKTLSKNGLLKDYLEIEYKDKDKLYIPVEKIDMLSKYASKDGAIPKINKLGTQEWEKTKLKARKQAESIAQDLIKLYAEREKSIGFTYDEDTKEQYDFEKEFSYIETPDQIKVITEIKKDMESSHPMDRLLCGDVGYGKTEVAFRAMFKAIMSSKQVAMMCPTTILSNQHYKNALERFKNFPINIALLNRFVSKKETNRVLKELKEGKIDILFGTHRIISDDVEFKDLGLLVIDEEQRFGVKHKEKIKQYKNSIDVLTLSATPIPRTLQMSLSGIRSLSMIETPPSNRYPIQTYVLEENEQIIKDAVYKELSRKGQTYILFNNVADMESKKKELEKLIPEARIISANGQMNKNELEDIMIKFINHEYDVLLCTTIIETGIDIPNVNTLIIYNAQLFGLSQLYQIRGRVGRGNKIAYAYLFYSKQKILSEIATKRLKVIKDFTELGSGFAIATRDLSLRGAGDILSSEQAGFINSVGIELFMEILDEEIQKQKGIEPEKQESLQPLIDVATSIDDKYAADEELKIELHKKINTITSKEDLIKLEEELKDRFGYIPEEVEIYMYEELFDNMARKMNITRIHQTKTFIEIILNKEQFEDINGQELFYKLNDISKMFRFKSFGHNLNIILDIIKLDKHFIYYLIDLLEAIDNSKK